MKREWFVRAYKEGDENKIFELMKVVYHEKNLIREKWLRWWKWMFTENPVGIARIWLAEHNGKIVGHDPMILADIKVGTEIVKVYQNIELMTHPDYRHQGMFLTLEKKALEEAEKEGINIIIGFPNNAAYPGHIKNGWFDISSLQIGSKPLRLERIIKATIKNKFLKTIYTVFGNLIIYLFYREKKMPVSDGLIISRIASFDDDIDDFWKKISNEHKIVIVRNKKYLNWRYVNVPDVEYMIYVAREKGEICGYIVLRCVDEKDMKSGSIFEVFAPLERPDITSSLLSKAEEYFKSQDVDLIFCSMIADKRLCKIFRKKGFIFSDFLISRFTDRGQFCAYTSHPNIPKTFFMNKKNWFIQLGDSDFV